MKLSPICMLVVALAVASSGWARDITTTTGEVYHNAVVTKVQPDGVRISHDDGVGFIDFQVLSEQDRKEFGYDPTTYAAAEKDQRNYDNRRRDLQLFAAQQALVAKAVAVAAMATGTPAPYFPQPPQTTIGASLDTPDFYNNNPGWVSWPYTVPSTFIQGSSFGFSRRAARTTGNATAPQALSSFRSQFQSPIVATPNQTTIGTSFGGKFGGTSVMSSSPSRR